MQGRLRARSTTSAPSITERTPSALTLTERAPSALILTERPPSDPPTTTTAPSTETITDSTSTDKEENLVQTTFKLPPPSTEIIFERSTDPPSTVEEDVFTETSVSMSIGQSEGNSFCLHFYVSCLFTFKYLGNLIVQQQLNLIALLRKLFTLQK